MSNLTVGSVHIPEAMNSISIRGRGKKWKNLSISYIDKYAKDKGVSFTTAYKQLISNLYCDDKENK